MLLGMIDSIYCCEDAKDYCTVVFESFTSNCLTGTVRYKASTFVTFSRLLAFPLDFSIIVCQARTALVFFAYQYTSH